MMDILDMDKLNDGFINAQDLNDKQLVHRTKPADTVEEHFEGARNWFLQV